MGYFSWMFADLDNQEAMKIGCTGYLVCPNSDTYATDGGYAGFGCFGYADHNDAFEEVANWNRQVLSMHPEYVVPQHGMILDKESGKYVPAAPMKISEFDWWPFYSDLSMSPADIQANMRELNGSPWEYRIIGIDLAAYDDQNASLPYPIKIASQPNVHYAHLAPSKVDPNQGF